MSKRPNIWCFVLVIFTLFTVGVAVGQKTTPRKPADTVALGEGEVKQLLLLMDTDRNDRISKAEFMKFMEAEFDRLDVNKNGELDVKELTRSLLRPAEPKAAGK